MDCALRGSRPDRGVARLQLERDAHAIMGHGWGSLKKKSLNSFILPSSFVCFLVISVGEYKSVVQGVFAAQSCMNNWIFYFKLEAVATGPTAMFSSSRLSG